MHSGGSAIENNIDVVALREEEIIRSTHYSEEGFPASQEPVDDRVLYSSSQAGCSQKLVCYGSPFYNFQWRITSNCVCM